MRPYQTTKRAKRVRADFKRRRVLFATLLAAGAGAHLRGLDWDEGATVLYLVGAPPRAGWGAWARSELPEGWRVAPSYYEGTTPILRYVSDDGRKVELHSALEWFGGGNLEEVVGAWELLELGVAEVFQGAGLLATPATTGRDLARRMFPRGHEYPALDDDTQTAIRSTLGQARIEGPQTLLGRYSGDELPGLFEYDGRLMYAALCWSMPAGVPFHVERPAWETIDDYSHGRYNVRARVPHDWPHAFGLLGVKDGRDGWRFPARAGESFRTWCDGAELRLARRNGWDLEIIESLTWPKTVPALRRWSEAMIELRARVGLLAEEGGYSTRVAELARAAVRQMVLTAIGAFQGRPHKVTHEAPIDDPPPDMPLERVRIEDDRYQWFTEEPVAWPAMSHPEWCATVWGRARARLLEAPGGAGALHMRPGTNLVALRTDAIYVDLWQPWEDDGKAGRFRLRRFTHSSVTTPRSSSALLETRKLLDRAE